ncbi:MAG: class I SAM-dependent DNA methyltransferase [Planctomycetota bacterium]|jgi:predicted TPR repeat methyltransferase
MTPSKADWRLSLATIDPTAAVRAVSLHAAQILVSHGERRAAEAAYRELLAREPDDLGALQTLAALLRQNGRLKEAAATLRRVHALEAARLGVAVERQAEAVDFLQSAEGVGQAPAAAPRAYVAALFDGYAERFDDHLSETLSYRGPQILHDAVACDLAPNANGLTVLDLGCGTGLAGERFRPLARLLHGVDLSFRMVDRAHAKGIYDRLFVGELTAFLSACGGAYDLIVAADVFCYLGDLQGVLAACRQVLARRGLLAFTVEADPGAGYRLRATRRYAHGRGYLEAACREAGLIVLRLEEIVLRRQGDRPVAAYLCVLRNGPASASRTPPG